MRLATRANGRRDGALIVVSGDGTRYLPTDGTMQSALDQWHRCEQVLRALAVRLDAGQGEPLDPETLLAPLPRAWQWLDGSAFATHGELMQQAFRLPPIETDRPLMYQGMSHRFLSGHADVALPSEADGIDFEGEFAIVTDDVPMGCSADDALGHIHLILLLNDWSLRAIAPIEMKTGFGWVQAKPACSVAPFAVTPDELGDAWRDGRVCLPLSVEVNGTWFGSPLGDAMAYGFHELIAHAARTRDLPAGTIIGSGTVSNANHAEVGSTCLSERRAIEMIEHGSPQTPFLRFGDRVAMHAGDRFGRLDQQVVRG
ncbi:fumarylacetoacetate hydrolase family protein [Sphingomonas carotinifaciens]|uniref:Fumarylacetoacetate (FAA) hydrolase n=1 Tax=Sphingomonas carotinifaciens TaxID=1166323 RepID=A0A1G7PR36_9SPHN|nr:fumarylacetoacetate hydrolase family protein [Sphingomonas carotinifaciens]MBB4087468.1 fumarylacetoacetate (FAA) hydrolase [Sphingomonas carotinifaciens]MWC45556.1 fumarylacetoacetate hydrolase [Sphingomonas carotinifaciens]SDF88684.1 fumarylacetoacetate (FAA) hydrolase [Sphingomonas carotinifaciens]